MIGFEVDFGFAPDFFENGNDDELVSDSNVTTSMANVIVGVPIGSAAGIRPCASGGAGLLRSRVSGPGDLFDISDNSFGINVGGGMHVFFNEGFGVRGDIRYFRSVQDSTSGRDIDLDLGGFNFWRATGGATFRF